MTRGIKWITQLYFQVLVTPSCSRFMIKLENRTRELYPILHALRQRKSFFCNVIRLLLQSTEIIHREKFNNMEIIWNLPIPPVFPLFNYRENIWNFKVYRGIRYFFFIILPLRNHKFYHKNSNVSNFQFHRISIIKFPIFIQLDRKISLTLCISNIGHLLSQNFQFLPSLTFSSS